MIDESGRYETTCTYCISEQWKHLNNFKEYQGKQTSGKQHKDPVLARTYRNRLQLLKGNWLNQLLMITVY